MGRMQRQKGQRFEQLIARRFRERFPELADVAWRSIQARDPEGADVVVPGLWLELQDARVPTPLRKLQQAVRDHTDLHFPVAITHRLRAKTIQATMRTVDYWRLLASGFGHQEEVPVAFSSMVPLTIDFEDFLDILQRVRPWRTLERSGAPPDAEVLGH